MVPSLTGHGMQFTFYFNCRMPRGLRWRLAGKRAVREGSRGPYPGQKKEESKTRQKEMSCQPVSMDTSSDLAGSSEVEMTLQICHAVAWGRGYASLAKATPRGADSRGQHTQ